MNDEKPIDRAARIVGGRDVLARLCEVTPAAVGNWKLRGVPVHYCLRIEVATGGAVTRRDLRPDDWQSIWPDLAEAQDSEPNKAQAPTTQAPAAINDEVNGEGAHV